MTFMIQKINKKKKSKKKSGVRKEKSRTKKIRRFAIEFLPVDKEAWAHGRFAGGTIGLETTATKNSQGFRLSYDHQQGRSTSQPTFAFVVKRQSPSEWTFAYRKVGFHFRCRKNTTKDQRFPLKLLLHPRWRREVRLSCTVPDLAASMQTTAEFSRAFCNRTDLGCRKSTIRAHIRWRWRSSMHRSRVSRAINMAGKFGCYDNGISPAADRTLSTRDENMQGWQEEWTRDDGARGERLPQEVFGLFWPPKLPWSALGTCSQGECAHVHTSSEYHVLIDFVLHTGLHCELGITLSARPERPLR